VVDSAEARSEGCQRLRRAVDSYREVLGAQNERTVSLLLRLSAVHAMRAEYAEAAEAAEEVMKTLDATLGEAHPRSMAAAHNLARCLYPLGEVAAARALLRRVLLGLRATGSAEAEIGKAERDLRIVEGWKNLQYDSDYSAEEARVREERRLRLYQDSRGNKYFDVDNIKQTARSAVAGRQLGGKDNGARLESWASKHAVPAGLDTMGRRLAKESTTDE
jgi:tetratricopeptide (TPR) repeat protein